MSIEDARRLVAEHRDDIAAAIRAQTDVLVPGFKNVDPAARQATIVNVIATLEKVLAGKGTGGLMRLVLDLAKLRKMTGLHESEFIAAMFCYLPVVRRVFRAREPDLAKATAAFDAVESWALPLLAEIVRSLVPNEEEISEADTISDGRNRINLTPVPFDI